MKKRKVEAIAEEQFTKTWSLIDAIMLDLCSGLRIHTWQEMTVYFYYNRLLRNIGLEI